MTALFLKLVNMSITASWLVLAVILLRLLLKRAPKALHCLLWALVAIRLICPFTLESNVSLVPRQEPISVQTFHAEPVEPSPRVEYEVVIHEDPTGGISVSEPVMHVTHTGGPFPFLHWLTGIWLVGMALLLIWAAESYLRIRRQVAPSVFVGNGVWICDHIDTPFILGLIRPRIYLPSDLKGRDADHVLAHERSHLKRKDHWWKPLGFLLLSIYWFNPVMWLAYILLCRDIEMACDEKVIKELGTEEKKAYSTALLNCSLPRHQIAACPLAFGEVGVKRRVKNILHYKKPAFWIVMIAVILSIIAAVCLLTDPAEGMYLYEIDDSRNYSDLFTNTETVTLVVEGEDYPVRNEGALLDALNEITVTPFTLNRSREETRDKTHQVHLRGNTYLNFSHNFSRVWIDNGVKPTYSYRVKQPKQVRELFDTMKVDALAGTTDSINWRLPVEVQAEGYTYFGPQYDDNSLFLGACKENKYMVLYFEKNKSGQYDFQEIYPIVTEDFWGESYFACRIPTPQGKRTIILNKNPNTTGLQSSAASFFYLRITEHPSLAVLDENAAEGVIRRLTEVPPVLHFSRDVSGLPAFSSSGTPYYVYMNYVIYYDGIHKPGSFGCEEEEMEQLATLLAELGSDDLIPCEKPRQMPLYADLMLHISDGFSRQSTPYALEFYHTGQDAYLILYPGLGETLYADPEFYLIQDTELAAYLASFCDHSRREVTVAAQDIDNPIVYTHDEVTIRIVPYWNWEYEVVEYTDENNPFGIRGRPKNQSEGWLFFSCWPSGFETDTLYQEESVMGSSYPDGTPWETRYLWNYSEDPANLDPDIRIWSSIEFPDIPGNFAIINDGADAWFESHGNEISFSWDIDTFQYRP